MTTIEDRRRHHCRYSRRASSSLVHPRYVMNPNRKILSVTFYPFVRQQSRNDLGRRKPREAPVLGNMLHILLILPAATSHSKPIHGANHPLAKPVHAATNGRHRGKHRRFFDVFYTDPVLTASTSTPRTNLNLSPPMSSSCFSTHPLKDYCGSKEPR